MKHVFTVHSPITFFISFCIFKHLGISEDDAIIIASNYSVPIKFGRTVDSYEGLNTGVFVKFMKHNLPNSYDRYISDITNGHNFIAYVDLMHAYQRVLVTHENCETFHFMEEGTASYVLPDNLLELAHMTKKQTGFRVKGVKDLLFSLRRIMRGHTVSLLSLPYHPQSYKYFPNIKYFTFSRDGYPGVSSDKRVVLTPSLSDDELSALTYITNMDDSTIWVEEAYPRDYNVSEDLYVKAIKKTYTLLNENQKERLFIKLRPKQNKEQSVLYRTLKEMDADFRVIPDEAVAEAIFVNSKNLTVIALTSSLLFYAEVFGHTAYSFYDILEGKPQTMYDSLPSFWGKVEKL